MKVVMKPIEMIAWFTDRGVPKPIRYRICKDDGGKHVVKVDNILETSEEQLAGNKMLIYKCQSQVQGTNKIYELKYELATCKWYLSKI